jgi:dnd system-associated protein 4
MSPTVRYEKNELYEEFAEGDDAPFALYQLLMLSASVGFKENERVTSPDLHDKPIKWELFAGKKRVTAVIAALAYADTQDEDVLLDVDAQIESLQAYAAGGARLLAEEVLEQDGNNLENLIGYIKDNRQQKKMTEQVGILEDIENDIGSIPARQD